MSIIGHRLVCRLRWRAFARKGARGMQPADRAAIASDTGCARVLSGRTTAMGAPNVASRVFGAGPAT
jgi:hypothetical protein